MTAKEHIQNILDAGHNKELRDELITYVGTSKSRMKVLMSFFFHEKWRYGQRASWAVGYIGVKDPLLISPYLSRMVEILLDEEVHDALKRNTVRIFEDIDIPEDIEGALYDKCISLVCDLKSATAIRCLSLSVCGKIADKYPELRSEVLEIVKEFMPHGTAGFKHRCKKIIARYDR